jgi:hypothetical protein
MGPVEAGTPHRYCAGQWQLVLPRRRASTGEQTELEGLRVPVFVLIAELIIGVTVLSLHAASESDLEQWCVLTGACGTLCVASHPDLGRPSLADRRSWRTVGQQAAVVAVAVSCTRMTPGGTGLLRVAGSCYAHGHWSEQKGAGEPHCASDQCPCGCNPTLCSEYCAGQSRVAGTPVGFDCDKYGPPDGT